jgi:hypothetical protein
MPGSISTGSASGESRTPVTITVPNVIDGDLDKFCVGCGQKTSTRQKRINEVTEQLQKAREASIKRRKIQEKHNQENGITPTTIKKHLLKFEAEDLGNFSPEHNTIKKLEIKKKTERKERVETEKNKLKFNNVRDELNLTYSKMYLLNIPKNIVKCNQAVQAVVYPEVPKRKRINQYLFKSITSLDDIKNRLREFYTTRTKAFKISLSFGFVTETQKTVKGKEDENNYQKTYYEYIYKTFKPSYTDFYWSAELVQNKTQLEHLVNRIDKDSIINHIQLMNASGSSTRPPIAIFSMWVKIFDMQYNIGAKIDLPKYITDSPNIVSMADSINNMCFWNCYAFHITKDKRCFKKGKELFEKFYGKKSNKEYLGFDINNELERFEEIEQIGVNIFEIDEEGITFVRKSL